MESKRICQSCSIPLNSPEHSGTEKDGSRKKHYCKYCYQDGQFTQSYLSLEEMKTHVRNTMEAMKIDADVIDLTVSCLPNLKRWRKAETVLL